MNILLIGNGFDLAHGLPTRYTDFLKFCDFIGLLYNLDFDVKEYLKEVGSSSDNNMSEKDKLLVKICEQRTINKKRLGNSSCVFQTVEINKEYDEFYKNIGKNIWIEYFQKRDKHGKENWIDFESEISSVIQSLDFDMHGGDNDFGLYDEVINILSNDFLEDHEQIRELEIFKEIKDILYIDLSRLIRALEIYLAEYVNKIECKLISPDINKIMVEIVEHENNIKGARMSKVLCFNYTDTFERIYEKSQYNDIDYIHGKAKIEHTIETNNMVLGIDEFLSKKRRNKNIEFIEFKKFYQRIHKETGCKYKEWVNKIQEDYYEYIQKQIEKEVREKGYLANSVQTITDWLSKQAIKDKKCRKHSLYIFGHSLDVTDKDILKDLILNDNVYTTIFYHNKDAMGQQIANLVKVIGQDELIRRTGGSTKTIEFKQQQDMKPIRVINKYVTRIARNKPFPPSKITESLEK